MAISNKQRRSIHFLNTDECDQREAKKQRKEGRFTDARRDTGTDSHYRLLALARVSELAREQALQQKSRPAMKAVAVISDDEEENARQQDSMKSFLAVKNLPVGRPLPAAPRLPQLPPGQVAMSNE
jgi:hypothetical protein